MTKQIPHKITLPIKDSTLPINHCNLPASVLYSLAYNATPSPLTLDGVNVLHKHLFRFLNEMKFFEERLALFNRYMTAHFQLDDLSQMGQCDKAKVNRKRVNYKRIILGWHMNPDGLEGAVLKRWVESRFGLSPRFHKSPIRSYEDEAYYAYLVESSAGVYNTNAIESQLDVLFSYSQYELARLNVRHITLYRGFNGLHSHEILERNGRNITLLLNNVNSFSNNMETAEHFGDYIMRVDVPVYKIFCYNDILPGQINAEGEYIVIGGMYAATLL